MSEINRLRQYWLKIELLEPTIVSESSASVGGHHCLDYLPGRLFLGVAARLYASLGRDAWTVFHSGKVRFLDAYPCRKFDANPRAAAASLATVARPTPLSLHAIKGAAASVGKSQHPRWYNLASAEHQPDPNAQYNQRRGDYVFVGESANDARLVRPISVVHQTFWKTAMDPKKGPRPRESHIFQYEAIQAGQTFATCVQFDSEVDESLVETILEAICGDQTLGRARTAEFGRAMVTRMKDLQGPSNTPEPLEALQARIGSTSRLLIYLTADLALLNTVHGTVRLAPEGADFGLGEGWKIDPDASFLRFRSYDRFNSFQNTHEIQRQVIARGSVLVFVHDNPLTAPEIQRLYQHQLSGIGLERQEGLGQFEVQPSWLSQPIFEVIDSAKSEDPIDQDVERLLKQMSPGERKLRAFARSRHTPSLSDEENRVVVGALRVLGGYYATHADRFEVGDLKDLPSPSQWGNLRNWAAGRIDQIFERGALLGFLSGTHQHLEKGWQRPGPEDSPTLAAWLCGVVEGMEDPSRQHLLMAEFARLARHQILQNHKTAGVFS